MKGIRSCVKAKIFNTIEQTMHISGALEKIKNPRNSTVLIECMSNLVANEMFEPGGNTQSIIKECMTTVINVVI